MRAWWSPPTSTSGRTGTPSSPAWPWGTSPRARSTPCSTARGRSEPGRPAGRAVRPVLAAQVQLEGQDVELVVEVVARLHRQLLAVVEGAPAGGLQPRHQLHGEGVGVHHEE